MIWWNIYKLLRLDAHKLCECWRLLLMMEFTLMHPYLSKLGRDGFFLIVLPHLEAHFHQFGIKLYCGVTGSGEGAWQIFLDLVKSGSVLLSFVGSTTALRWYVPAFSSKYYFQMKLFFLPSNVLAPILSSKSSLFVCLLTFWCCSCLLGPTGWLSPWISSRSKSDQMGSLEASNYLARAVFWWTVQRISLCLSGERGGLPYRSRLWLIGAKLLL